MIVWESRIQCLNVGIGEPLNPHTDALDGRCVTMLAETSDRMPT